MFLRSLTFLTNVNHVTRIRGLLLINLLLIFCNHSTCLHRISSLFRPFHFPFSPQCYAFTLPILRRPRRWFLFPLPRCRRNAGIVFDNLITFNSRRISASPTSTFALIPRHRVARRGIDEIIGVRKTEGRSSRSNVWQRLRRLRKFVAALFLKFQLKADAWVVEDQRFADVAPDLESWRKLYSRRAFVAFRRESSDCTSGWISRGVLANWINSDGIFPRYPSSRVNQINNANYVNYVNRNE